MTLSVCLPTRLLLLLLLGDMCRMCRVRVFFLLVWFLHLLLASFVFTISLLDNGDDYYYYDYQYYYYYYYYYCYHQYDYTATAIDLIIICFLLKNKFHHVKTKYVIES